MVEDAYKRAGVDIAAGDALVDRIKPYAKATHRAGVIGGLGGFGGLFALGAKYRDPVLVSGTDGVGTKLLLAHTLGRYDTVGVDLVAMCVNDIVVTGAEPLFFLDYFATSKLDVDAAAAVIAGIAAGCQLAGCALLGGETAEMPGLYQPGHYDLAGFAVGVVERDALVDGRLIGVGHRLVGVPSSGLHSNGFSLVRKIIADAALDLHTDPGGLGEALGEALLRPTRIYVKDILALRQQFPVHGLAHITGGGLPGNVPRMLPEGLGARLWRDAWRVPPIFDLLREAGALAQSDLDLTFNQGLGMVLAVPAADASAVAAAVGGWVVGEVVADPEQAAVLA